jgi:hypothetical protein
MHPVAAVLWIATSTGAGAIASLLAHVLPLPAGTEYVFFIFAAISVFGATRSYFFAFLADKTSAATRPGIDTFRKDVARWRTSAFGFSILHYSLGIVGIGSSSLAAAHPSLIVRDASVGQVVSWVAALTTALITFVGAQAKAGRFREAATRLEVWVSRYDIDTTITFDHVANAQAECANLLRAGK